MPSRSVIASPCWQTAESGESVPSKSCAAKPIVPAQIWRRSFLLSPETSLARGAPVWPLFAKDLREIVSGRALWTLLLLSCPLFRYSFCQSTSLYGEASAAAANSPVFPTGLSPLDGV